MSKKIDIVNVIANIFAYAVGITLGLFISHKLGLIETYNNYIEKVEVSDE